MNIAKFSIKHSVTTMMIILSMIILGFLTLLNLKTELMPNSNLPTASIRVSWKGASPEDMEKLVTTEIESAIGDVEGIKRVTTNSKFGSSAITVEFNYGVDIDSKVNDLVTAVSRARNNLPDDINEPVIKKSGASNSRVLLIGVNGTDLIALKTYIDNILTPRFEKIEGVESVDSFGGLNKEIKIEINPEKLESYGLTVMDLYTLLNSSSLNFPAGYIADGGKEFLVKLSAEVKTLEDVKKIVLKNQDGKTLYLSDVADISLGIKDRESYGRVNGNDNIIVSISKSDSGNTVDISKRVQDELKKIESTLPKGASFSIIRDSARDINRSISTVKSNAITGLVLASIILFIFLKNIRATLVVAISIPVSIMATFGFFGAKGMTLNIISLMGLSLGVGMLVDNSIVVLDNIFRHLTEMKKDKVTASEEGAKEVVVPIIASTATTIAVFLPIVLREGRAKETYQDMAYSITFSLLASLIIAITFIPMISSKILSSQIKLHQDGKFMKFVKSKYETILKWSLSHIKTIIITTTILFFSILWIGGRYIGGEYMPRTDDGVYSVIAELPTGMELNKSNEVAKKIESIISKNSYTKKYTASINKESASISVDIGDKNERDKTVSEVMAEIRKKIGTIPDVKLNIVPFLSFGRGVSRDIKVILKSDDLSQLEYISKELMKKMEETKYFTDITNSMLNGNPEVNIILDRKKMAYYGVTAKDLTMSTSYQILGGAPIKIKTRVEEVDVTIRLAEKYRNSIEKLKNIIIKRSNGKNVYLKDITKFEIGEGAYGIEKEDKITVISVSANLNKGYDLVTTQNSIKKILEEMKIPKNVSYIFGGDGRSLAEINSELSFTFIVAIFLIYFILASQFESYILPLIVMGSVPLSIIGVYIGLLTTGQKTNTMVFVGIIMLAGIVVNNAIVLIDYIKVLMERKVALKQAILEAGVTRIRPIFMTTMTTVFGMLPLALGIGQGSELYRGMAIAVIFGLTFSTTLTLIFIPVIFYGYERLKERLKNNRFFS